MTASDHRANLTRLLTGVRGLGKGRARKTAHARTAREIAERIPLSHTTTGENFRQVLSTGELRSAVGEARSSGGTGRKRRPSVEKVLGTEDSVFLFAGPFSYPWTTHGLLWQATQEKGSRVDGEASPFDSGGLVDVFTLPDLSESPRDFLDQHRLPLWEHRRYLKEKLLIFFADPADYVTLPQDDTSIEDTVIGLTGGDRRRWTHEVRVRHRLDVRTELLAVIVPAASIAAFSTVLGSWFSEGVRVLDYRPEDEGDYEAMRRRCVEFLVDHLGIVP